MIAEDADAEGNQKHQGSQQSMIDHALDEFGQREKGLRVVFKTMEHEEPRSGKQFTAVRMEYP
jgi:hypothetical protein